MAPGSATATLAAMGGLIDSVGNGITGLIAGAFDAIGAALRGIVDAGQPGAPGRAVRSWSSFVLLLAGAWSLAKR